MNGKSVGIVGTGISGLTLALRLQQLGADPTIYSEISAAQHAGGRLPNTVVRFDNTIQRERELGLDFGELDLPESRLLRLSVKGDPPLEFEATIDGTVSAMDFRLLLPKMLDLYLSRGGKFQQIDGPATPEAVDGLSAGHDLMVVAVGRRAGSIFSTDPSRSPYSQPQRVLMAGFFTGITPPEPLGLSFNVSPGAGELFQMPFVSRRGPATNLLIEAVPGGPLERVVRVSPEDEDFAATILEGLREHAPRIAEMIDEKNFALRAAEDLLQGAITPVVRRAWTVLGGGKLAMAVGDAWITNDPVTGQGANLGSHSAWTMADAIINAAVYDEDFAQAVEEKMWELAGPVTEWTNAFLQPPPEHVVRFLVACAQDQDKANTFWNLFDEPAKLWELLSSPARSNAFVSSGS